LADVDVYFADRQLAETCSTERELKRRFGAVRAKRIGVRLQQLRVADTLHDLRSLTARVHELRGDLAGLVALDLDGPYRLLVEPAMTDGQTDGPLDWSAVTAVVVTEITDYH
jgi:proteic killer suppression protein